MVYMYVYISIDETNIVLLIWNSFDTMRPQVARIESKQINK